jgi:uncharacterized FAD-dependent dehydrogenase
MLADAACRVVRVLQTAQIDDDAHGQRLELSAMAAYHGKICNGVWMNGTMLRLNDVILPLQHSVAELRAAILARLGIEDSNLLDFSIFRRAWDARAKHHIKLVYAIDATVADEAAVLAANRPGVTPSPDISYPFVARFAAPPKLRPVVIGTGPCGIFAALVMAQMGLDPIILERGKQVRERTADTWGLWRRGELNPESNVQFGEGGAGTFSDGKLYSQIKDPNHLGRKVLTEFVAAGAPEEILYAGKPHIGTFRLVGRVEAMRASIENLGGEYRFGAKVVGLHLGRGRRVTGVELQSGEVIAAEHVVLAIGHSARDTFEMLDQNGVFIEPKAFSVGFRIEHPQSMIDRHRFGGFAGNPILGAADYKLVHHAGNGRSVYSFCMCPGGTVVAAASEAGGVVTNGMSQYSRNERNANAGIVVGITPADYPQHRLAGIEFQRRWEAAAYLAGGERYAAPGQLVGDFLGGRPSKAFGDVMPSYKPGVTLTNLSPCLPDYAIAAIREALPAFETQIPGFARPDAVLTGVETRTSSPIRIKRDKNFQSLNTPGLFPAGEGAGYAGGILSAGVDGIKVAEAVARQILRNG